MGMAEKDVRPERRVVSQVEFTQSWDTERRVVELNDILVNIKGTTLYIPAKTMSVWQETYGGPVSTVKYRTFEEDFRVWLTPCRPEEEGARPLRPLSDTRGSAQLAFAIPLRKLHIKVPSTRQYSFPLQPLPVEGGGTIYELSFRKFEDIRRKIDEEVREITKQAKAEEAKAKRAERLAKARENAQKTKPPGTAPESA
jgi:hypothetical protein